MKQFFFKSLLISLLPILWGACSDENSSPEGDVNNNELQISIDTKNNEIASKGGSFFLKIETNGEWVVSSKESWCTFNKKNGNGKGSVMCTVGTNTGKQRNTLITVTSGKDIQEITLTQKDGSGGTPDPDPDPDPNPEPPSGEYAKRIEVPALKGGTNNLFYTHTSNYNGKKVITYSAEYDCSQKHTRWVAFTFDNVSNQKNTNRSDKWGQDPYIPAAYRTYDNDYNSPYNRGHLVASADRYVTREANVQTFYYSNMSPQIVKFNGGVWNQMEEKVRSWSQSLSAQDTVYVVKGGQIDGTVADGTLIEYTGNHVAVPKYYFMAVLSLKNGKYKAMAFYINQQSYSGSSLGSYAISIDALEQKTGINFFHNLPDAKEIEVEKTYNNSDWGL